MKYLMEKKNHCMHSFERLVRKMSMQIKDPREQDIFCSLLTRMMVVVMFNDIRKLIV